MARSNSIHYVFKWGKFLDIIFLYTWVTKMRRWRHQVAQVQSPYLTFIHVTEILSPIIISNIFSEATGPIEAAFLYWNLMKHADIRTDINSQTSPKFGYIVLFALKLLTLEYLNSPYLTVSQAKRVYTLFKLHKTRWKWDKHQILDEFEIQLYCTIRLRATYLWVLKVNGPKWYGGPIIL